MSKFMNEDFQRGKIKEEKEGEDWGVYITKFIEENRACFS